MGRSLPSKLEYRMLRSFAAWIRTHSVAADGGAGGRSNWLRARNKLRNEKALVSKRVRWDMWPSRRGGRPANHQQALARMLGKKGEAEDWMKSYPGGLATRDD